MWQFAKVKCKETIQKTLGKTLMENQGIFMVMSGIFPVSSYYTIAVGTLLLFINCILAYTAGIFYFVDFNMSLFSETAHFFVVISCAICFYVVFWFRKERIYNISKLLERDFYHYGDTIDPETKQEIYEMTKKMKNRKKKISLMVTIFYNICGFFGVILFPLIFREKTMGVTANGIYMSVPVVIYFPLTGDFGWYLCVFIEFLATFFITNALNGTDVAFSSFCEEGCNQLLILCCTIRHAVRRARYVHRNKFGMEPVTLQEHRYSICMKMCLNDSVKHHYAVNSYFQEIQALFSWCVMVVMMAGALLLCLSGIFFFTDNVEFGTKICFTIYLIGEMLHTFIYAWYGEQMSEKSAEIRNALYELEWEECSITVKPYIIIMQAYMNTPLTLKGADFMEYNLKTFGSICSSAYSYINLLSAAMHSPQ